MHYKIFYGAPRSNRESAGPLQCLEANTLELFADASFCAGADRSQSGMILQWNDAPVAWLSLRQPTASLSTAEAELQTWNIPWLQFYPQFPSYPRELNWKDNVCGALQVLAVNVHGLNSGV